MSAPRRKRRWRLSLTIAALLLGVGLTLAFVPRPDLYGDTTFSRAIADRDGGLLRLTLADDERYRLWAGIDDIAPALVDATLLYEDRHFFRHPGFDPAALLRSAWVTYGTRERVMGGSTITMQLARMRYGIDSRTIGGKLEQILRAVQIERHHSKQEILEAYLNTAPYGGNIEGVAAASLIYFGKPARRLSLPEALALAVIPQNPAKRVPVSGDGYLEALAARERLRDRWQRQYGMDDETRAQFDMPLAVLSPRDLPFAAPHFVQSLAGHVRHSTLDPGLQSMLEGQIDRHVERFSRRGIRNASAMLVDRRNMQILAAVGSADFFDAELQGQVDGTTAKRSPGSTLKPFVYGLAMDRGLIHPMTMLKDAPKRFAAYTPENYERGFMGPVFAADALVYSRNLPAIELLAAVGPEAFNRFLLQAGVRDLRGHDYYGLAAVLGGMELSMREIVALYAMLANDGVYRPLIDDVQSETTAGRRMMSAEAAFLVLDILRANPRPDALQTTAAPPGTSIAWKTGTSFAFRDAWSVGVMGPYVLAVWVGNFDGSGNPAFVGREAAAPLFFAVADSLAADTSLDFSPPAPAPGMNLRKVEVCARSGDLPGRHCPDTVPAWFIPGVSPIRVSNVHRLVHVDRRTGLRSCNPDPALTASQVYEFWPSDIAQLFEQAGVAVRQPPPWSPDCGMDVLAATGLPPDITSLSERLTYQIAGGASAGLALIASTDADAGRLYWFVDDHFVGAAGRNEPLIWQPVAGKHRILAVDDLGRSDARQITVAQAR